jgi:hypothetical protein
MRIRYTSGTSCTMEHTNWSLQTCNARVQHVHINKTINQKKQYPKNKNMQKRRKKTNTKIKFLENQKSKIETRLQNQVSIADLKKIGIWAVVLSFKKNQISLQSFLNVSL